jgi:hypothetical protein
MSPSSSSLRFSPPFAAAADPFSADIVHFKSEDFYPDKLTKLESGMLLYTEILAY